MSLSIGKSNIFWEDSINDNKLNNDKDYDKNTFFSMDSNNYRVNKLDNKQ